MQTFSFADPSSMVAEDLAGQTMAKQKGLIFRKFYIRGFFRRERDNILSVAQVVGMKCPYPCVRVCGRKSFFPYVIFLNGNIVSSHHLSIVKESYNGKA
jgi:hypothetical protein